MYKEKLGIPQEHELVRTSSKNEQRKGRDTDIYGYDEITADGEIIAKYVVRDSMSIYPPQSTTVSYVKYDAHGEQIGSGNL
ncbi:MULTISPECIES: hypothetical protein [Vibrio diabolicus subgroup]|uniref:hypothetical protein n=1 Tax=Vibrio diabolicus subgroup TaxID=2315253 RepID=UPI000A18C4DA|nr:MULTISPECIES: hypothetical protein [Vibrio diabolicus subgroup]UDY81589.1 hypothetical protein LJY22_08505 [Vibrio diabolicus]